MIPYSVTISIWQDVNAQIENGMCNGICDASTSSRGVLTKCNVIYYWAAAEPNWPRLFPFV